MFAPNQDVMRFHNRQLFNEYGMRSIPIGDLKQQRRVLVFGDSVLNGGSLTDHRDLATSLATDDVTFYGNVSAGSWGPANIGAWIDRYGFLDAVAAVVVLNEGDLLDLPTFAPLNPTTHPTKTPPLALWEAVTRYLPRYLPRAAREPDLEVISSELRAEGQAEVHALIDRFLNANLPVCLILHLSMEEVDQGETPERAELRDIFNARGVPVVDFGDDLIAAMRGGNKPFFDQVHLNPYGQKLLAPNITACAKKARVPAPFAQQTTDTAR